MSERAADVRERYRELVSDGPAFMESLLTALPSVIWPQPERLDRAGLAALFEARSEPVAWTSDALRLEGVDRPGKHWGHWTGLYYVQEEASLLPARLLDAKPGERVLDLCAAPGSKTARIAFALENRGTIVANDRKATRHAATSASLARLGLANVTTTVADGSTLPDAIGTWDCVLVDAPCTAEGNLGPRTRESGDYRTFIAGVQEALLRRALELCRPGGRVVYSTCTFAPEENEAVLDAALRAFEDVDVVEVEIDGLRTSPGIDAWRGRTFDPRVRRALRLWPHESGTGGFFAALLHKAGDGVAEGGVPVVRSSATEGFELLLRPDGASTLTVRFDPRDWLSSASFDSLVEDAACSVGAEVVCAGSVEQRCAADGGVAEMRDCADFDQACVRGVGCVDSVALDADGIARWPATPPGTGAAWTATA